MTSSTPSYTPCAELPLGEDADPYCSRFGLRGRHKQHRELLPCGLRGGELLLERALGPAFSVTVRSVTRDLSGGTADFGRRPGARTVHS